MNMTGPTQLEILPGTAFSGGVCNVRNNSSKGEVEAWQLSPLHQFPSVTHFLVTHFLHTILGP
jgi:hypothetical protein